jgi:hypothetical protein
VLDFVDEPGHGEGQACYRNLTIVIGAQGANIDLRLDSLRYPVPGVALPGGRTAQRDRSAPDREPSGTNPSVERSPDGTITEHFAPLFRGRTTALMLRATLM